MSCLPFERIAWWVPEAASRNDSADLSRRHVRGWRTLQNEDVGWTDGEWFFVPRTASQALRMLRYSGTAARSVRSRS